MINLSNTQPETGLEEQLTLSASPSAREVSSTALLGARDALTIRHQDEVYFLRRTRAGKLILTK